MKILIYEDSGYKKLFPLNMLRAVYDLRCGANTILQRAESIIKNKFVISLHCRQILSEYLKEVHSQKMNQITKDDYLLLNGRAIFTENSLNYLLSRKEKNVYYNLGSGIVAAYISKDKSISLKNKAECNDGENILDKEFFDSIGLKQIDLSVKDISVIKVINYPWDLIDHMVHGGLDEDLNYFLAAKENKKLKRISKAVNNINYKNIFVAKNVKLFPGVVLDADSGAIVIEENSVIEPFTYIKGPAYIGRNSLLKSCTKIYGPCVIGDDSKVAGEIAESVFHSYVNKQHDGFTGHSYICPFVNLGADTVTSDLKNNYSKVKMRIDNEEVNSGMQFLGSMIGDHSKTSINTMLNTGSYIGIFANIFGGGFHDKEIKSFSWNEAGKPSSRYEIDKAIKAAKTVMKRREIKMSRCYENLVRSYS